MKKILSIALVLILMLTVAFAETTGGSITINDAVVGQTYTI